MAVPPFVVGDGLVPGWVLPAETSATPHTCTRPAC